MRLSLVVVGILVLLAGTVWALQGANVLQGSGMSGNAFWLWTGVVLVPAGLVVAAFGARSPNRAKAM